MSRQCISSHLHVGSLGMRLVLPAFPNFVLILLFIYIGLRILLWKGEKVLFMFILRFMPSFHLVPLDFRQGNCECFFHLIN